MSHAPTPVNAPHRFCVRCRAYRPVTPGCRAGVFVGQRRHGGGHGLPRVPFVCASCNQRAA